MLYRLEAKHLPQIKAYLKAHPYETVYLEKPVEWLDAGSIPGEFYGFFSEEQLLGLFYFSNKNSLVFHYSDAQVLGHLDLLRAVRHHQPKYIKGEKGAMDGLYRILCRNFSDVRESTVKLMVYESMNAIESCTLASGFQRVDRETRIRIQAPQFFVDVENAFGRQRQSVNDVLKRNLELLAQGDYILILKSDIPVAQGLIEEETRVTAVLGGIYTVPSHRGQGLGRFISCALTREVLGRGKNPVLFVEKRNVEAQGLYRAIGYAEKMDYSILTVAY